MTFVAQMSDVAFWFLVFNQEKYIRIRQFKKTNSIPMKINTSSVFILEFTNICSEDLV